MDGKVILGSQFLHADSEKIPNGQNASGASVVENTPERHFAEIYTIALPYFSVKDFQ